MKLLIAALFGAFLFSGSLPLLADTVELVEEPAFDPLALWDYAWRTAVPFGGVFTIILSARARTFLKGLTFDQFVEIGISIIERLSKTPARAQAIFAGIMQAPFAKKGFEQGKALLLTRINQIDEQILEWQIKIDSGLVDEKVNDILKLIEKLQAEKVRLLELHAQGS